MANAHTQVLARHTPVAAGLDGGLPDGLGLGQQLLGPQPQLGDAGLERCRPGAGAL